jgi:hypothetical protein
MMKQQFSSEAMKNTFDQSMKIYPATAVKKGDNWKMENTVSISGMNVITKTTYTLKEITKNEAIVSVESTVDMQPTAGMDGKLQGTHTGAITIDIKSGMIVSSDSKMNMKGAIKAQGIDIQMDMDTQTTITTKEIK